MSTKQGYKRTDIGEIPEEWNVVSLGELLKEVNIKARNLKTDIEKLPILSMTRYKGLILQAEKFGKRVAGKNIENYKVVKRNNIVYGFPMDEGVIYALRRFEIGLVSPTYFVWELIKENIDIDFLDAMLKTPRLISIYTMLSSKTVHRRRIVKKGDFKSIRVPIPPFSEQQEIATILSAVEDAIQKTDAVIGKAEALKRGLMQQLLTRGIGHTKFKQTELGVIPKEWEVMQYSKLCSKITVGIVVKPAKYYVDSGVPCLRSFNILEDRIEPFDFVYISQDANRLHSKSILRTGDVVTVRTGKPGLTAVITSTYDGANCVDLIVSRPNKLINPHFLSRFLNSHLARRQIISWQGGSMQQHLNVGTIKKLRILLPPRDEQDEIVKILQICDDKLSRERESKKLFETLKLGLMQTLLTGKVRVKVD